MAEITSSSVTSSAVPRKLVSRRSMRMARSLSALPRKALINCRRSVSLRGRKSMDSSPSQYEAPSTAEGVDKIRRPQGRHTHLRPRRQLREQQVNPSVHAVVVVLDFEQFPATDEIVTHLLGPDQHLNGIAGFGKRQGKEQTRPPLVGNHLEAHPRLLTVKTVDALGVELQRRPNLMQR